MAYATAAEFIASVGSAEALALTVAAGGAMDAPDEAVIDAKLADVSAIIDTYLAGRVSTPVSPAPRTLTVAAIALAREALDRQGRDFVKAEADRVRAWLVDISKGRAQIGGGASDGSEAAPAASAGVEFIAPPRRIRTDGGCW